MELKQANSLEPHSGEWGIPFPTVFHPCIVLYLIDVLGTILQKGEIMHVYWQSSLFKLGRRNYRDY